MYTQRRKFLAPKTLQIRGCGGMLPQKVVKCRVSEMHFLLFPISLQKGKLCNNIINVNVLVLIECEELLKSSISRLSLVLRKGVFSLFILLKLRSAVQVDTR